MVQTAVIPIILGLALIIGGYTLLRKLDKMKQNGVLVEGIIFSFDGSSSYSGNDSGPVIRFVTKEGVWVTKEYSEGISHSFMKSGQKVRVIYDPDNPENFVVSSTTPKWLPYLLLVIGFGVFGYGTYQLVQLV